MSIAVALSGGADSLLALCLLHEQGHGPVAVHASFLAPSAREDRLQEELSRVCTQLGVPLHCVDVHQEFKHLVIQPFVQAYARGLTPNPCSWCNRRIKFGIMLQAAEALGLSRVATGHYAQLHRDCPSPPGLFRGQDRNKDQSYFLALVGREELQKADFPLAQWTKDRVRSELAARGLQPATSRESQEICFIPDNDYRSFLAAQDVSLSGPGDIVDTDGRILGRHQGLHGYTLGQRRGLGIAHSEPLYVLDKDMDENVLVVGPGWQLQATSCRVGRINALVEVPDWPERIWIQTNYRQTAGPARVQVWGKELGVFFEQLRPPAPPGQIAVFYSDSGRVLGGGEIHA
ncbi:MAG: tRNA 2-thiouridine(34) synthase MnmA [Desulfovermiculus sp.]|nr:tRNA 2-thiouridine(34) synthase MnmA [Desulfovermiculus sp.]